MRIMYADGKGTTVDKREAIEYLRKPASQYGYPLAALRLGFIYNSGDGVPQDYAEASRWFKIASDGGLARAQFNLALMHSSGLGVERDDSAALMLYRKAAEKGLAEAQFNLGLFYQQGRGVAERDLKECMKWCLLAAGQGLMQAQAFLAGAYADGIGVPKDDVVAYSWANLAAAQGDETARKLRDVLERRMTQEQIGEAQRRSREFKPKVLDSSAVK